MTYQVKSSVPDGGIRFLLKRRSILDERLSTERKSAGITVAEVVRPHRVLAGFQVKVEHYRREDGGSTDLSRMTLVGSHFGLLFLCQSCILTAVFKDKKNV